MEKQQPMFLVKRADRAIDMSAIRPSEKMLSAGDPVLSVPDHLLKPGVVYLRDAKNQIHGIPHTLVASLRALGEVFIIPTEDLQEIPEEGAQFVAIALNVPARVLADLLKSLG